MAYRPTQLAVPPGASAAADSTSESSTDRPQPRPGSLPAGLELLKLITADKELLRLAGSVFPTCLTHPQDIEAWAERLARDVAGAGD